LNSFEFRYVGNGSKALILAYLSGGLAVLTLLWHNWIELLLGAEPDGGDGSVEWGIVVVFLILTVVFSALARTEWRGPTQLEST
jgi:hypothetical protein